MNADSASMNPCSRMGTWSSLSSPIIVLLPALIAHTGNLLSSYRFLTLSSFKTGIVLASGLRSRYVILLQIARLDTLITLNAASAFN